MASVDQTCPQYLSSGGRITGGTRCGKPAPVPVPGLRGETLWYCRRHANRILQQRAEREAAEAEAARLAV